MSVCIRAGLHASGAAIRMGQPSERGSIQSGAAFRVGQPLEWGSIQSGAASEWGGIRVGVALGQGSIRVGKHQSDWGSSRQEQHQTGAASE